MARAGSAVLCDSIRRSINLGRIGRHPPEPLREALRTMIRALSGEALFFFLPFVLFALYLVVRPRNPLKIAAWSDATAWLVIAALACAVAALLYTRLTG